MDDNFDADFLSLKPLIVGYSRHGRKRFYVMLLEVHIKTENSCQR